MTLQFLAGAVLALGSTVGFAQDTDPGDAPAEATATAAVPTEGTLPTEETEPDPSQEVICRTDRVTGSLVRRRRTCMTRAEWDGVEARTRDGVNGLQRGASGSQCIPTDPQSGRC